MTPKTKTFHEQVEEVLKKKEKWDELISIWNNKKLDIKEREIAENKIHILTDEGRGEIEIDKEIETLLSAGKWFLEELNNNFDAYRNLNNDTFKTLKRIEEQLKQDIARFKEAGK
jgi:hypothetical protein